MIFFAFLMRFGSFCMRFAWFSWTLGRCSAPGDALRQREDRHLGDLQAARAHGLAAHPRAAGQRGERRARLRRLLLRGT